MSIKARKGKAHKVTTSVDRNKARFARRETGSGLFFLRLAGRQR